MRTTRAAIRSTAAVAIALTMVLGVACGGDDSDDDRSTGLDADEQGLGADSDDESDDPVGGPGSGTGISSLVVNGEDLDVSDPVCRFAPDPELTDGIEALALLVGTNAEGHEFELEAARSEESAGFAGDHLTLVVDDGAPLTTTYQQTAMPLGSIEFDPAAVSGSAITVTSPTSDTDIAVTFEVAC